MPWTFYAPSPDNGWKIAWPATAAESPTASYATFDIRGDGHPVLDFDASADESAYFRGMLPVSYALGGLTVKVLWAATSATSGNVIWEVSIERITVNGHDLDANSFATAVTASAAADGTSGEIVETSFSFAHGSAMDSLVAGEMFRLKVTRDANGTNGTDDMTGDAEVIFVTMQEA